MPYHSVWLLWSSAFLLLGGIPLEELAFGFTFGLYWAGLYEHLSGKGGVARRPPLVSPL